MKTIFLTAALLALGGCRPGDFDELHQRLRVPEASVPPDPPDISAPEERVPAVADTSANPRVTEGSTNEAEAPDLVRDAHEGAVSGASTDSRASEDAPRASPTLDASAPAAASPPGGRPQPAGSLPLPFFRYYRSASKDHLYTTNDRETQGKSDWAAEGYDCLVYPTQVWGTVALYRYYYGERGNHFYTTNYAELGAGRNGWRS